VSLSAGKAFRGEYVGLRETAEDGCYEVWWYSTKVGMIDLKRVDHHGERVLKSVHHVPEHLSTMSPDRTLGKEPNP
jgi:hypothetical protein